MKTRLLILAIFFTLFLVVFQYKKEMASPLVEEGSNAIAKSSRGDLSNEKPIAQVLFPTNSHPIIESIKQEVRENKTRSAKTTAFEEGSKEAGMITFTSMINASLNDYYAEKFTEKDKENFLKALATLNNKQYYSIVEVAFNQSIMNKDNELLQASSASLVAMNTQDGMDIIMTKLTDPTLSVTSRHVIASALATANSPEQFSVLNKMIEQQIEGYHYAIEGLFNTDGGMKYLVDKLSEQDSRQQRENTMAVIATLQEVRADIVTSFTDNLSIYNPQLLNEFMQY